ncbi:MAG: hypothetical protein M3442_19280, partial [Chloroflexota bacterium]|nr:hypothetical protein [Chloroflexota bacterium]
MTSTPARPLFSPVDLAKHCSPPAASAAAWADPATAAALAALPSGAQRFWGIPFQVAVADPAVSGPSTGGGAAGAAGAAGAPAWILLGAGASPAITVPLADPLADPQSRGAPTYLLLLHACGMPPSESGACLLNT